MKTTFSLSVFTFAVALTLLLPACAKPQPTPQTSSKAPPITRQNTEKWTLLTTNSVTGVSLYYDRSGLDFARETGRLWIRRTGDKQLLLQQLQTNRIDPATLTRIQQEYDYTIDSIQINLQNQTLWHAASTYYNANHQPLASVSSGQSNFQPAQPNTLSEKIFNLLRPAN